MGRAAYLCLTQVMDPAQWKIFHRIVHRYRGKRFNCAEQFRRFHHLLTKCNTFI